MIPQDQATPANTAGTSSLCDNLSTHGWSLHDHFLPPTLMRSLAAECRHLHEENILKSARVGSGNAPTLQTQIRGDKIAWLQTGQSTACDTYLQLMEQVRVLINENLYLGLEEYETHFAFYTPGASYQQHKDRFNDNDARTISVVIYLNEDWQTEQGGALRLHPAGLATQDVLPMASRMVIFLSAEMLHEVLPATRDRMSLTGWFRRRT